MGVKRADICGVGGCGVLCTVGTSVHSPGNGMHVICFNDPSPLGCSGSAGGTAQVCSAEPLVGLKT